MGLINTIGGANTNTAITVTTSDTLIINSNTQRRGIIIVNDGTNIVYLILGSGAAVANSGVRLNASGGSIQLDNNSNYTGMIRGIAVGGSSVVTVCEL